jgi:hypothetical protein
MRVSLMNWLTGVLVKASRADGRNAGVGTVGRALYGVFATTRLRRRPRTTYLQ